MSFGYSVGDALQVLKLLKDEYGRWQAAPKQYEDLINEVEVLQLSLEAIHGTFNNTEHQQLIALLKDWRELLSDVDSFTAKHGGLSSSAPRPKDRARFRFDLNKYNSHMQKLQRTRERLLLLSNAVSAQKIDKIYQNQHMGQLSISAGPAASNAYIADQDRISKSKFGGPIRCDSDKFRSSSIGTASFTSTSLKSRVDGAFSAVEDDKSMRKTELRLSAAKTLVDTSRRASEPQQPVNRTVTTVSTASTLVGSASGERSSPRSRQSSLKSFINGFGGNSSINQGGSSPYLRREREVTRKDDVSTVDGELTKERQRRRNTEDSTSRQPFSPKTFLNGLGKSSPGLQY
ncbi:hypothetical protein MMC30_002267 [Trapelia coarctata]|nr:hypothetical protein [Trapelia coarctata]